MKIKPMTWFEAYQDGEWCGHRHATLLAAQVCLAHQDWHDGAVVKVTAQFVWPDGVVRAFLPRQKGA